MRTQWENSNSILPILHLLVFVFGVFWQFPRAAFAEAVISNASQDQSPAESVVGTQKHEIFLPLVMTSSQWQRINLQAQGPINARSLDIVDGLLYVGDQRSTETDGGLYQANVLGCASGLSFSKKLSASISRMAFPQQHGLAGSYGQGAYFRAENDMWTSISATPLPPLVYAFSYAETQSLVFAGASTGVFQSADWGKSWFTTTDSITFPLTLVNHANSIWIGTYATGVWTLDLSGLSVSSKQFNLPTARIWDMTFDETGNVYIATAQGVYVEQANDEQNQWVEAGLQTKEVFALEIGGQRLYAGVKKGGVESLALTSPNPELWKPEQGGGLDSSYSTYDLLYVNNDSCRGLLAGTEDGVWVLK